MRYIFLCLSLFLAACAPYEPTKPAKIDEAFLPFLEEYKKDKEYYLGTRSIKKIDIIFYTTYPGIGTCSVHKNGKREIKINPYFWHYSTYYEKIILMYHELGHCDLGQHHREGFLSIMNSYLMYESEYLVNPEYYKEELFLHQ